MVEELKGCACVMAGNTQDCSMHYPCASIWTIFPIHFRALIVITLPLSALLLHIVYPVLLDRCSML